MSLYSSMSPKAIQKRIERDQTTGEPISTDARQRIADITALAAENVKAWRLAESMPCADQIIDGFNLVADMTPEMEQAMNEMILREELK
jgi:hypothetical protein